MTQLNRSGIPAPVFLLRRSTVSLKASGEKKRSDMKTSAQLTTTLDEEEEEKEPARHS